MSFNVNFYHQKYNVWPIAQTNLYRPEQHHNADSTNVNGEEESEIGFLPAPQEFFFGEAEQEEFNQLIGKS